MKIAILTLFYKNYNYGGALQAYALKNAIDRLDNCEAETLMYREANNLIYPNAKERAKQYGLKSILSKILEKGLEKFSFLIRKCISKRIQFFDEFATQCQNKDGVVYSDANITEALNKYESFVSGSDQVWNPNCINNGFLQNFVGEDKKKISYAASIGRKKLTEKECDIMVPSIKTFDYISVREETARKVLHNSLENDIKVVCDPVFLLCIDEWNKVANDAVKPEKPYVLVYAFSDSRKIRKKIYRQCQKEKKELLYIPYAKQKYNCYDGKGLGVKMLNVGPREFISLIRNADCIYTDSFHATAFSIIYNKRFCVFERDNGKKETSMNSRLYDLLSKFGLEDKMMKNNNILDCQGNLNYNVVNKKITNYREESICFLKNAISSNLGKENI